MQRSGRTTFWEERTRVKALMKNYLDPFEKNWKVHFGWSLIDEQEVGKVGEVRRDHVMQVFSPSAVESR